MDFKLTEEQELFKETVRRFVENEVKPLAAHIDETDEFPEELWKKFAEMGFFGLRYPEEYGGSNCDVLTFCLFCEEIARGSLPVAFQVTMQAFQSTDFIAKYGDDEVKENYLVPAIKGTKHGAFSVTEPEAGSDLGSMKTTAVRDGDYFILNGSKTWCTGAPYADFFIIGAMTDKSKKFWGIDFFVVDRDTPGFQVGRHIPKYGMRGLKEAELSLDNVRVPAKMALAGTGVGGKYLQGILAEIRVVTGALALGIAEAAFEEALNYAKQRIAFGRPIGRFQSIAHKLAFLRTDLEAARLMVYWAAWILDQKGRESREAIMPAAMAKNAACEMAFRAVDIGWKIHGALGFSSEVPVNRFFRDAGGLYLGGGTTEINNDIIARELGLYG
ncbi:MAG: acyl-CoA dehydrogenase [Thermoprotei archaeon]|nr:MAG: acyl-CoA dehydrogenase [Thermoprotei archaeon]RLF17325.1 MAG: acyl-CoA dehydrogenase [Thermoprotei archaeon]